MKIIIGCDHAGFEYKEILINLIREKKVSEIYSQLQMGSQYGMSTLEQCLNNLYSEGLITEDEALRKASNPKALKF